MNYVYVAVPYLYAAGSLIAAASFVTAILAMCALRGGSVEAPEPPNAVQKAVDLGIIR